MRVLSAGLSVCDVLIRPISRDAFDKDTSTVEQIALMGGGDAYNVAINLAALDTQVTLVTCVGDDDFGIMLFKRARDAGVNTESVIVKDVPTSTSAVLIDSDGERHFLSMKGACHTLSENDIQESVLAEHDVFYVGSAFDLPALDGCGLDVLMGKAHTLGLTTVLDVTADLSAEHMQMLIPVLPSITLFVPSYDQICSLTGEKKPELAAKKIRSFGCENVVVKLGSKGCVLISGEETHWAPAYSTKVIDTTGAGDAFVSGLIAAMTRGMKLVDSIRYGNAAGSICVSRVGASGALKGFAQLTGIIERMVAG